VGKKNCVPDCEKKSADFFCWLKQDATSFQIVGNFCEKKELREILSLILRICEKKWQKKLILHITILTNFEIRT
jgi:hypothetical protein